MIELATLPLTIVAVLIMAFTYLFLGVLGLLVLAVLSVLLTWGIDAYLHPEDMDDDADEPDELPPEVKYHPVDPDGQPDIAYLADYRGRDVGAGPYPWAP